MAYYDLFYLLVGISVALRELVRRETQRDSRLLVPSGVVAVVSGADPVSLL
jgi:hypothetical protein